MREVTLFLVVSNTDSAEGKGANIYHYFLDRDDAEVFARQAGPMGSRVPVEKANCWENNGTYFEVRKINVASKETLREKALAKLTPAERRVLGIQ